MPDTDHRQRDLENKNYSASEYVRLEADFLTGGPPGKTESKKWNKLKITVLLISQLFEILKDIALELESGLGGEVTVIPVSDSSTVIDLLKKGNVDLVLYNPGPDLMAGSSIMDALQSGDHFCFRSTLILLRKSDDDLQNWVQHPSHSEHLMRAINRMNE